MKYEWLDEPLLSPPGAEVLRGLYPEALPGFCTGKRSRIACLPDGGLPDNALRGLCGQSHRLVLGKPPKNIQRGILGD